MIIERKKEMIADLGTKLGEWFYKQSIINIKDIDVIRYGLEIFVSEILVSFVILVIGVIRNSFLDTLIYFFFFHLFRKLFKGYHAKTITKCTMLTISSYLLCIYLGNIITEQYIILISILSVLIQLVYCLKRNEKATIFLCLFIKVCIIFLFKDFYVLINIMLITEFLVSVATLFRKEES